MEQTKNQRLLHQVVSKAWEDADFKNQLIAQPMETIKKLTGETLDIPAGKNLVIIDGTDETKVYVNLPKKNTSLEDIELSDEELEKVAGGTIGEDVGVIDSCFGPCDDDFPWLDYEVKI